MGDLRLFNADPYAAPDATANNIRDGYLLAYRGNTRGSYESDLKLWFRWCADRGVDVLAATRRDIETYDLEVESSGLRPATRQRKLIAICGFYAYAEQEDTIDKSPGRYVRRPRVPQISTSQYLERYELGPFLAAADARGAQHGALCCLLSLNGLRVSEVTEADVTDLTFARGHRTLTITRKGGAQAEVPLAARTFRSVLKAVGDRPDGPLLLDGNGNRMTRHSAARAVRLAASRAGIAKKIGPHSLRHTYISLGLDAGVPLRDMQTDAGHAHPGTTVRYDRRGQNLDRHSTYIVAAFVGAG